MYEFFEKWQSAASFKKNAGAMFFYLTEVEKWAPHIAKKVICAPVKSCTRYSACSNRMWYSMHYSPHTLWRVIYNFAKGRRKWFRVKDFTSTGTYDRDPRRHLDHMHMYMDFLRLVWCGVLDVKLDDDIDTKRRVMYFKITKDAQKTLDAYQIAYRNVKPRKRSRVSTRTSPPQYENTTLGQSN